LKHGTFNAVKYIASGLTFRRHVRKYPHHDPSRSQLLPIIRPSTSAARYHSPRPLLPQRASYPPPTMSKSPKESTRFTATGVWAHTRPGGRATTLQFADPAPKNETPQQKVKRLREAANRAKMAQVTRWDYMYLYGRNAADALHRFTVYGLIFATGMKTPARGPIAVQLGHHEEDRMLTFRKGALVSSQYSQ
jgi:hypothetical protein